MDLKLYFERASFGSIEEARSNFLRNWEAHNPNVVRQLNGKSPEDVFEGAHYRNGRWYFCNEVNNYTLLDPSPSRFGAENVIDTCPRGRKAGLVRKGNWQVANTYVHLSALEDGKEVAISFCEIRREPPSQTIDYSS